MFIKFYWKYSWTRRATGCDTRSFYVFWEVDKNRFSSTWIKWFYCRPQLFLLFLVCRCHNWYLSVALTISPKIKSVLSLNKLTYPLLNYVFFFKLTTYYTHCFSFYISNHILYSFQDEPLKRVIIIILITFKVSVCI